MTPVCNEQDIPSARHPVKLSGQLGDQIVWFIFILLVGAFGALPWYVTTLPPVWLVFGLSAAALALVAWQKPEVGLILVLLLLPFDREKKFGAVQAEARNAIDFILAVCCLAGLF